MYRQYYLDKSLNTIIQHSHRNRESSYWEGCEAHQYDWWVFNRETALFEPLCSKMSLLVCDGSHNPIISRAEEFHTRCSMNTILLDYEFHHIKDERIRENHSDIYMHTKSLLNLFVQVTRKTTGKKSLGIPNSRGLFIHSDDRWCMSGSWHHLSFFAMMIRFSEFSLATLG